MSTASRRAAYGTRQPDAVNKQALLLLTFFLGGIGAHKFYVGKYRQGALYMLFSWTLVPAVIAFTEFAAYCFTSSHRLSAKYSATHSVPVIVLLSVVYFVALGILATIAIKAHGDYETRAAISEGLVPANGLRNAIGEAFRNNGPTDMTCNPDRCGFAAAPVGHSASVRRITSDKTGVITIEYEEHAAPAPQNRLTISPRIDGKPADLSDHRNTGRDLTWACGQDPATTVASKHIPLSCRHATD